MSQAKNKEGGNTERAGMYLGRISTRQQGGPSKRNTRINNDEGGEVVTEQRGEQENNLRGDGQARGITTNRSGEWG